MSDKIPKIKFPELFFGLVDPVGVDLTETIDNFETQLAVIWLQNEADKGHRGILGIEHKAPLDVTLRETPTEIRYDTYISYGDAVRTRLNQDAFCHDVDR